MSKRSGPQAPAAHGSTLRIDARFCGPPASGNGGYVAGRLVALADLASAPTTVTLRRPPPIDKPLTVVLNAADALLYDGDVVVAHAMPGAFMHDLVPPITSAQASAAHASYAGLDDHSFDGCFVCGPGRRDGDGMRLSPGQVADGMTACVWIPDASLSSADDSSNAAYEFVWAAMDCPGGWTSDLIARPLVLGRMTAFVERLPTIAEPVVVVGRLIETAGRKSIAAVTAYDEDQQVLGRAEQVWIEVDAAAFYPEDPRASR